MDSYPSATGTTTQNPEMWVVLATMMAPIDGVRSIIASLLSGIKGRPLKYSFPAPWNTRHLPYLVSQQQEIMVFCSVYELLINSQTIN